MPGDPRRKRVDLYRLPAWERWLLVLATVALVVGLALLFAQPGAHATVPVPAIAGALIAFAVLAWRAQRR
jgi:hypothetical protein